MTYEQLEANRDGERDALQEAVPEPEADGDVDWEEHYTLAAVQGYAHRLLEWLIDSEDCGVVLRPDKEGRLHQVYPDDIDGVLRDFGEHEADRAVDAAERRADRA